MKLAERRSEQIACGFGCAVSGLTFSMSQNLAIAVAAGMAFNAMVSI